LPWVKIDEPDTVVVQFLLRRGNAGRSSHGKWHRSLICALTRNEGHLREWVIRNLLAGFGHIVLYNNNQVERDRPGHSADAGTVRGCRRRGWSIQKF